MKKCLALFILPLCLTLPLVGDDGATPKKEETTEQPKLELKAPFTLMTPAEQAETGITKLTPAEQEALVKWWHKQRCAPDRHTITKEVTIASIQDEGKRLTFDDGTSVTLCSSYRKKTARWAVGDKIGFGEPGKRGSVSLYHMATGQKVKAKRDQAPEDKSNHKK